MKINKKIGYSLLLLLAPIYLAACSTETSQTSSSSSQEKTEETSTPSTTASSSEKTNESGLPGMQQVGSEEFGYVYVPDDWVSFFDIGTNGGTFQYSDVVGYNIITLFAYSKDDLGVTTIDDAAVELAANSYYSVLSDSETFEGLTGAMAEVSGYTAYQVYGHSTTDGKLLCAWIFKADSDEKVYLISFEGDEETFVEQLPYIEETWSETKE